MVTMTDFEEMVEGREAFRAKHNEDDCPYPYGQKRVAWLAGWYAAEDDASK